MRNFKKFLALVLAMLMVSACAVSVSAAFTDQAAIDKTDFAAAVEMLELLGVIKGDENKNFNPNNTLRRDEAAVMISKLVAGAEGQSMDWTAATTKFDDVDAEWSFAYINYVADRKIMIGTDKGFEPTRELQLDEAIALALKAANPAKVREVEVQYAQSPTSYWATYYIAAAEDMGLAEGLGVIYDYEAACTKGMFAQVIYNVLNYDVNAGVENAKAERPFLDAFDVDKIYSTIVSVDDDSVNLANDDEINLAAFNAKLDEGTAADYIDHNVTIFYAKKANTIYSVEITSTAKVMTYADALITRVVKDNANTDKITIDGVTYVVNGEDGVGSTGGIGGGTAVTNAVAVEGFGTTADIPAYYKAKALDDNADGKYDRLLVDVYHVGILVDGGQENVDDDDAKEQLTEIQVFGEDTLTGVTFGDVDYLADATFTGKYTSAVYGNTPVLFYVEDNNVDILEVAATDVKGEVSNFKEDSYINIGDKKVSFAAEYLNPDKWVLGQNVAIYTIGGKFVNVVNEDATTGMAVQNIFVDNVTVENGVALIDGYIINANGTLTAVEDFDVVGIVKNDKLIAKASAELKNSNNTDSKTYAGFVGIGTLNDAGDAWKVTNGVADCSVQFADGYAYTFKVTNAGAYYVAEYADGRLDQYAAADATAKVEIKGGYYYVDGVAVNKFEDAYSVVSKTTSTDAEVIKNAYATDTYKLLDSFKYDSAKAALLSTTYEAVASNQSTVKVALVYVTAASNTEADAEQTKLNDGETIVKIVEVENEALSESTYLASDIFTGAKVEVTGNADEGDYAIVDKDGKIVSVDPLWIDELTLDVEIKMDGKTIKGYNSKIVDPVADGVANYRADIVPDSGKVTFGIDAVKYWVYEDGFIKEAADLDATLNKTGTVSFKGCIINGVAVILEILAY